MTSTPLNQETVSPTIHAIRRMDLFLAILAGFLLTVVAFSLIPQVEHNPVRGYVTMANNPYSFYSFPYGTRLLTPLIVHFMPWKVDLDFRYFTALNFALSGALIYLLVRLFGLRPGLTLVLLPLFYFAPAARFIIETPWYVDPLSYTCLLLFFIGLLIKHPGLTVLGLTAGAFNRPESLIAAPLLFIVWWDRKKPLQSIGQAMLCILPGLFIALTIRFAWPHVSDFGMIQKLAGTTLDPNSEKIADVFRQQGVKVLWDPQVYREMMPYLWGAALVGAFTASGRIALACLVYIFLTACTLMVASDFYRLPFFAFPSILVLAAAGLAGLQRIHWGWATGLLVLSSAQLVWQPFNLWLNLVVGVGVLGWILWRNRNQFDSTRQSNRAVGSIEG